MALNSSLNKQQIILGLSLFIFGSFVFTIVLTLVLSFNPEESPRHGRFAGSRQRIVPYQDPALIPAPTYENHPIAPNAHLYSPAEYPLEPEWEWARNVSIVYTWVNGSDPEHLRLKALYNGGKATPDSRDRASSQEMRYSLRSLKLALPWHTGEIYIVSPRHTPSWLDLAYPGITIIDQATLLPSEANPTFNSFAVEQFLDRVPGLTDLFIQMNDDYFFKSYAHPSLFFTREKTPIFFWESWQLAVSQNRARKAKIIKDIEQGTGVFPTWERKFEGSIIRTAELLKVYLNQTERRVYAIRHAPFSWERSSFALMRETFAAQLNGTMARKFRHEADYVPTYLNQATYISRGIQKIALADRNFQFASVDDNPGKNVRTFEILRNSRAILFNLNDDYEGDAAGWEMRKFLDELFPEKGSWELDGIGW